MPRKENMRELNADIGGDDFGVFTLNETSVGAGGNNQRRSDVQLIQFFLQSFYLEHPELFSVVPKTKGGSPIIKIDGINGKQTELGILHFQIHFEANKPDGLVSIARRVTNLHGSPYTIMNLNNHFRLHGNGKEFHGQLENHPIIKTFAPELQAELASAQVGDTLINE